jgi:hypothetical protein
MQISAFQPRFSAQIELSHSDKKEKLPFRMKTTCFGCRREEQENKIEM